jgi:hypothetical protein
VHNSPLINADPTGHWCEATVNGKFYSHPGNCTDSGNKATFDDNKRDGQAIINNGKVTEYFNFVPGDGVRKPGFGENLATNATATVVIAGAIVYGSAAWVAAESSAAARTIAGTSAVLASKATTLGSKAWEWGKGLLTSTNEASVNLLSLSIEKDDVIIGAFNNGKVTKQFLMMTDGVNGHKAFLEGTEVGFTIYKDVFSGEIVIKGSGTASAIGGRYATPAELSKIADIFGMK